MIDHATIENFDISQILGKWFEIARFDNEFEKDMFDVTAEYKMINSNLIQVTNIGNKEDKKVPMIGLAKIPNKDIQSQLKVSFFVGDDSDFYIYDFKPYEYLVIGSSNDEYLWILSSKEDIDFTHLLNILDRLSKRGYDTNKFIYKNKAIRY